MARKLAILLALLSCHTTVVHADFAGFTDGDFSSWSPFYEVRDDPTLVTPGPGTSNGTGSTVSSDGNPDAYFRVEHTFTTGDVIFTGGIKTDFLLDPALDGPLDALMFGADVRQLTFPTGSTALRFVVEQGGQKFYSNPMHVFSGSTWLFVMAESLSAANFDTNPQAGSNGVLPDGVHPDFSIAGDPLQFGFVFGNRVVGNGTLTHILGLDNFSVNPVPLPPAIWLFGSALAGLSAFRRAAAKRAVRNRLA